MTGINDMDVRTEQTGAPTDVTGGMPATAGVPPETELTADEMRLVADIAGYLIPAADNMPSAADVVNDDRVRFVLRARPDLFDPLRSALRSDLGDGVEGRLRALADEPTNLAALQLTIVGGYYTDKRVRDLIGYPGQVAIEVKSWLVPEYLEEGLIDAVLARGPVWRDPNTGRRAELADQPRTYADRFTETAPGAQGGNDGRDGA